jgi:hypothetical protein
LKLFTLPKTAFLNLEDHALPPPIITCTWLSRKRTAPRTLTRSSRPEVAKRSINQQQMKGNHTKMNAVLNTPQTARITLYYREGSSDKVYQVSIEPQGEGFVVNFAYGRRGSTMNTRTKVDPVLSINSRKGDSHAAAR